MTFAPPISPPLCRYSYLYMVLAPDLDAIYDYANFSVNMNCGFLQLV